LELEKTEIKEDIYELIKGSIIEEPSLAMKEGGIIKDGFHKEVDKYRNAKTEGKKLACRA